MRTFAGSMTIDHWMLTFLERRIADNGFCG